MKKKRLSFKRISYVVLALLLLGAVTSGGCSQKNVPAQGQAQELVIALGEKEVTSLDPYDPQGSSSSWYIQPMLFETLCYDTLKGTEPMLAQKWEMSPDGKEWTFHLREGVKFHDGSPLTAEAVKFSIEKSLANTISGLGARKPPVPISRVEAPDEKTVVVHLEKPYGPFLSEIANVRIVSPASYQGDKFARPVGTGPWVVASFNPQEMVFAPFEDYWRGKPKLSKVTIKCIPDPQARVMALEAGEVDVIGVDMQGVEPAAAKSLAASGKYQVISLHQAYLVALYFNPRAELLKDIRVRQAINYALNREEMVAKLLEGYGVPAKGPVGFDTSIPWTSPHIKGYPHDPEKAKALLKDAGFKGDAPLKLAYEGYRAYHKALAELIQAQLAAVGIKVELNSYESGAFTKVIQAGQYDLALIPPYGKREEDPYPYLGMFFFSQGRYKVMESAEFDRLFMAQLFTGNPKEREKLYWALQEEIMKNCPAAFLFHPDRITVLKKDIQGWESDYGFNSLTTLWKVSRG
ncbi:MAG: ABC transporter substrate-binding protein [Bacillota bacterium]|nr:ABC transporter substrate-binding protein [Bacillota bacterium]